MRGLSAAQQTLMNQSESNQPGSKSFIAFRLDKAKYFCRLISAGFLIRIFRTQVVIQERCNRADLHKLRSTEDQGGLDVGQ
jgi:hypothetical protein